MSDNSEQSFVISEQDANKILKNSKQVNKNAVLKKYSLRNASEKMLGFLSDYWKLEIQVIVDNTRVEYNNYFIKCISKANASKAKVVRELKLFDKELTFYVVIKEKINLPDLPPWSSNLIMSFNEAMVFDDLNFLHYEIRNKHEPFDEQHTLLALQTLARFHAGSLVYEEKKRKQSREYIIHEEHKDDLDRGGYVKSDPWFVQCMNGALEAVKSFSKYNKNLQILKEIENKWTGVWELALEFSHISFEYPNVICHRDLWNNNILFSYKKINNALVPENCVLVDFQAVTYQPPAGDVMLLLHCNLDHEYREKNMFLFLNYYYRELQNILVCNDVMIADIMTFDQFLSACQKYKLWALVVTACLVPQFWVDDDLTQNFFGDTESFREILIKDKGSFIKKMIGTSESYKNKVMQVFEEIVDIYCLNNTAI